MTVTSISNLLIRRQSGRLRDLGAHAEIAFDLGLCHRLACVVTGQFWLSHGPAAAQVSTSQD